jgi:hypothetical protein
MRNLKSNSEVATCKCILNGKMYKMNQCKQSQLYFISWISSARVSSLDRNEGAVSERPAPPSWVKYLATLFRITCGKWQLKSVSWPESAARLLAVNEANQLKSRGKWTCVDFDIRAV